MHGLFAEVVIDAKDLLFREHGVDRLIQSLGALEVVAEGLLDDDAFPALASLSDARGTEPVDDHGKELGGGGKVKDAVTGRAPLAIQAVELGGEPAVPALIIERHPHIGDALGEALPDGAIDRLGA